MLPIALPNNDYSANPFQDRTIIEFTDPCIEDAVVTASEPMTVELSDYDYTDTTPAVAFTVGGFMITPF